MPDRGSAQDNAFLKLAADGTGTLGALASQAAGSGQVHLVVDVSGYAE